MESGTTNYIVQSFRKQREELFADAPEIQHDAQMAIATAMQLSEYKIGVIVIRVVHDHKMDHAVQPAILFKSGELPPILAISSVPTEC